MWCRPSALDVIQEKEGEKKEKNKNEGKEDVEDDDKYSDMMNLKVCNVLYCKEHVE